MKTKMILLFLTLCTKLLFSQVQISLAVQQNTTPVFDQWKNNPQVVRVTLINSDPNKAESPYKFLAKLYKDDKLIADTNINKTPVKYLPMSVGTYSGEDIISGNAVSFYGNIKQTVIRTGMLPAGVYRLCLKIVDMQGNNLGVPEEVCASVFITDYQAPELIYPVNNQEIKHNVLQTTIFTWSPIAPPPPAIIGIKYRIVISEVLKNQTPQNAFDVNLPIVDQTVNNITQFRWPVEITPPQENKQYVWSIQPLTNDDKPYIREGNHFSKIGVFRVQKKSIIESDLTIINAIKTDSYIAETLSESNLFVVANESNTSKLSRYLENTATVTHFKDEEVSKMKPPQITSSVFIGNVKWFQAPKITKLEKERYKSTTIIGAIKKRQQEEEKPARQLHFNLNHLTSFGKFNLKKAKKYTYVGARVRVFLEESDGKRTFLGTTTANANGDFNLPIPSLDLLEGSKTKATRLVAGKWKNKDKLKLINQVKNENKANQIIHILNELRNRSYIVVEIDGKNSLNEKTFEPYEGKISLTDLKRGAKNINSNTFYNEYATLADPKNTNPIDYKMTLNGDKNKIVKIDLGNIYVAKPTSDVNIRIKSNKIVKKEHSVELLIYKKASTISKEEKEYYENNNWYKKKVKNHKFNKKNISGEQFALVDAFYLDGKIIDMGSSLGFGLPNYTEYRNLFPGTYYVEMMPDENTPFKKKFTSFTYKMNDSVKKILNLEFVKRDIIGVALAHNKSITSHIINQSVYLVVDTLDIINTKPKKNTSDYQKALSYNFTEAKTYYLPRVSLNTLLSSKYRIRDKLVFKTTTDEKGGFAFKDVPLLKGNKGYKIYFEGSIVPKFRIDKSSSVGSDGLKEGKLSAIYSDIEISRNFSTFLLNVATLKNAEGTLKNLLLPSYKNKPHHIKETFRKIKSSYTLYKNFQFKSLNEEQYTKANFNFKLKGEVGRKVLKIKDKNNQPVVNARLSVSGGSRFFYTDSKGFAALEFLEGKQKVLVEKLGFNTKKTKVQFIESSGKETLDQFKQKSIRGNQSYTQTISSLESAIKNAGVSNTKAENLIFTVKQANNKGDKENKNILDVAFFDGAKTNKKNVLNIQVLNTDKVYENAFKTMRKSETKPKNVIKSIEPKNEIANFIKKFIAKNPNVINEKEAYSSIMKAYGGDEKYLKNVDIITLQEKTNKVIFKVIDYTRTSGSRDNPVKNLEVKIAKVGNSKTNDKGECSFNLKPQEYKVTLLPSGLDNHLIKRELRIKIEDKERQTIKLKMYKGVEISGIVKSGRQRVPDAKVFVKGNKGLYEATSNGRGEYKLMVPAKNIKIVAQKKGYVEDSKSFISSTLEQKVRIPNTNFELESGGKYDISKLAGFNISLSKREKTADSTGVKYAEYWTGSFQEMQPMGSGAKDHIKKVSIPFNKVKVIFDDNGKPFSVAPVIKTDVKELKIKLFNALDLKFVAPKDYVVVQNDGAGGGVVKGALVFDEIQQSWSSAIKKTKKDAVLYLKNKAANIDSTATGITGWIRDDVIPFSAKATDKTMGWGETAGEWVEEYLDTLIVNSNKLSRKGILFDVIRSDKTFDASVKLSLMKPDAISDTIPLFELYGMKFNVDLTNSSVGLKGITLAGSVSFPKWKFMKDTEIAVKEFTFGYDRKIKRLELSMDKEKKFRMGDYFGLSISQVALDEYGYALGGGIKVKFYEKANPIDLSVKDLRIGKKGEFYGAKIYSDEDKIDVFGLFDIKNTKLGIARTPQTDIYTISGGGELHFHKYIEKIDVPRFEIRTDGEFMVTAPVNYTTDFMEPYLSITVKNITIGSPKEQSFPRISVGGNIKTSIEILTLEAGKLNFEIDHNKKLHVDIGEIKATFDVPAAKAELKFDLSAIKEKSINMKGSFEVKNTPIKAALEFAYQVNPNKTVKMSGKLEAGVNIPLGGVVALTKIKGGFSYNDTTGDTDVMVELGGGLSITGMETAASIDDLSLMVQASSAGWVVIKGKGSMKVAKYLDVANAKVILNTKEKFFTLEVDAEFKALKGLAEFKAKGLTRVNWNRDKPDFFLGLMAQAKLLTKGAGVYLAMGYNIEKPLSNSLYQDYFKNYNTFAVTQNPPMFSGVYIMGHIDFIDVSTGFKTGILNAHVVLRAGADVAFLGNFDESVEKEGVFAVGGYVYGSFSLSSFGWGWLHLEGGTCVLLKGGYQIPYAWYVEGNIGVIAKGHFILRRWSFDASTSAFVRYSQREGIDARASKGLNNTGNYCRGRLNR